MLNAINIANVTWDVRTFFDEVHLQKISWKVTVPLVFCCNFAFSSRYEIEISQDSRPFCDMCGYYVMSSLSPIKTFNIERATIFNFFFCIGLVTA